MAFLVDEDLGKRFSDVLNSHGYESLFAGDVMRSAPDDKILAFAEKENHIILTGDKDFGELIFRLEKPSKGVILFRTLTTDPEELFRLSKNMLARAQGRFIVVEEGRVRIRPL
ncbi:DUF5615 family PIN-like protein [Candidatus Woesearchaeota archaeon]|nr:DUF5615 family PIN-like protein [Candidatus Woesearchaeota archaeon]